MRRSNQDKTLLFEQEFVALLLMLTLGYLSHLLNENVTFYFWTFLVGFALYFWMVYEEGIHATGAKHAYFEHTSSYIMIAQTALALQLVSYFMSWAYLYIILMVISIVMFSVALSRILLFKLVFKDEHKKA